MSAADAAFGGMKGEWEQRMGAERSVLSQGANDMRKCAIAAGVISQFIVSAFAATEYWVAKDAVSKQCEVVTKKPDGTLVIPLTKTRYKTEAEANAAMTKMPSCKK
ncbi:MULTISPECIES: hypothetical protein [unclassified Mesorhizobium]|uniref:hypothetical protein n=1 Tax=unclassified Mesorhizobium TaxID=325217 RepID=UPI001FE13F8A|nr:MULTISPECIES: hypothetical protein [unclassified Mesorhizobium]